MGGSGSGVWRSLNARTTVERCLSLSANKLVRDGMIRATPWAGSLVWRNTCTGDQTASAGYTCTNDGAGWVFTLIYTVTRHDDEKHEVRLPIRLQVTRPNFGGIKWWFTCPLVARGRECQHRVGKLYLPPGGLYFGCRHCHDLTYTSCQESHKYDRLYALIAADTGYSPGTVRRLLEEDWP